MQCFQIRMHVKILSKYALILTFKVQCQSSALMYKINAQYTLIYQINLCINKLWHSESIHYHIKIKLFNKVIALTALISHHNHCHNN